MDLRFSAIISLALLSCCSSYHHPLAKGKAGRFSINVLKSHAPTEPSGHASEISDNISSLLARLSSNDIDQQGVTKSRQPRVYIIGTGLSNLVTSLPLTTLAIISKADVVLHDNLSLPTGEIYKVVRPDCLIQSVGKRGDKKDSVPQNEIDELILHYVREIKDEHRPKYPIIVRLKGGDPFLFGRSRTEIDALRESNVSYEVVPNLSSSVAGPHYAGIPLTDPFLKADSFAVFSGTNAEGVGIGKDDSGREFGELAVSTMVFLMIGRLDKLNALCQRLINSNGDRWSADTNCAVIRNAGRSEQQVWRATLNSIVQSIREDLGEGCATVSPAIFVVGEVTALDLNDQR